MTIETHRSGNYEDDEGDEVDFIPNMYAVSLPLYFPDPQHQHRIYLTSFTISSTPTGEFKAECVEDPFIVLPPQVYAQDTKPRPPFKPDLTQLTVPLEQLAYEQLLHDGITSVRETSRTQLTQAIIAVYRHVMEEQQLRMAYTIRHALAVLPAVIVSTIPEWEDCQMLTDFMNINMVDFEQYLNFVQNEGATIHGDGLYEK